VDFHSRVPGRYLNKALIANTSGLDPNFLYGEFLMRRDDCTGPSRVAASIEPAGASGC
jgi:hypothetical protein